MKMSQNKRDSRQLDESDYRSKNGDNVLRLWNSTLQILLPVAALAVIWGRRGLFTRFLLQFNKNCISVFCPSFKDKQRLLDWINYYISSKWFFYKDSTITTSIEFWKNGSLLCTLINSAIPGACSNPRRHWQHPPSHGQALAYKYLGIAPIFTERELTVKCLTEKQKNMLDKYISKLQRAVTKASIQDFKFSSTYIAKGMGLVSGEQFRKMYFYIYLNVPASFNTGDIVINIRAPYNTYHTLSIPFCGIKRTIIQKSLPITNNYPTKLQHSFFQSAFFDSGAFTDNEALEKSSNKIPITFLVENDRVKVIYIPQHSGIYEISIITNGFHLLGSPFPVSISENTSNVYDNFNESDIISNTKKNVTKKIVSEIIDFLDKRIEKDKSVLSTSTPTHITIAKNKDELNLNNSNKIISSICFDHIEPEVSNDLNPFLVLEENQSKGKSKQDMLSQINNSIYNIAFDEIPKYEDVHNDKLPILTKPISEVATYNSAENKNCSLNILNYLSHFKLDNKKNNNQNQIVEYYKNLYRINSISQSSCSLSSYDIHPYHDFKKILQFWKTQSNLNLTKKRKIAEQSHSLPNLDSINFVNKKVSNLTTKIVTERSDIARKHIKNIYSYSRYSLPNVYTNDDWVENKTDKYMDGLEFRNKFRHCLKYWQKLCLHSDSTDNLSLEQDSTDDKDSDFDYSLTNSNLFRHNEYLHSLFTDAYNNTIFEETRNYWENLSTFNMNHIDKDIEQDKLPKRSNSEIIKTKQELLYCVSKLNYYENKKHHHFTIEDDLLNNLTDDLKRINNYRENIKIRFNKNKHFFQSLESILR